ncbi:MAG: trypsin-like peptidase domain-containing protein [Clostridia bacterium]|nr:trypsin-like peptidase domain-containing protein [Clostridia bacterium]
MLRKLSFRTLAMLLAIVMMFSISVNATEAVPEGESVADVSAAKTVGVTGLDTVAEIFDDDFVGDMRDIGAETTDTGLTESSIEMFAYIYAANQAFDASFTIPETVSLQLEEISQLYSVSAKAEMSDFQISSIDSDNERSLLTSNSWVDVNVNAYPHSAIFFLRPWLDNLEDGIIGEEDDLDDTGPGTGFMIAPDIMLTAAHNVYDRDTGRYMDGIRIYSKQTSGSEYSAEYSAMVAFVDKRYVTESSDSYAFNYDWALVLLDASVALDVNHQYLGIGTTVNDLDGLDISVAGYYDVNNSDPEDPPNNPVLYKQRVCHGEIDSCYDRTISYGMNTKAGQSGAPVYNTYDGLSYAHGIHTKAGGEGTRITPVMYYFFCSKIDDSMERWGY